MSKKSQSKHSDRSDDTVSRKELIALLNEDLAREYQAIIAYVNYSQVLKGDDGLIFAGEVLVEKVDELLAREGGVGCACFIFCFVFGHFSLQ